MNPGSDTKRFTPPKKNPDHFMSSGFIFASKETETPVSFVSIL